MSCPDFMCMGFQKCGTSTLYQLLKQHPQVVLCRDVKEPMYYRVPLLHLLGGGKTYYSKRYFGHIAPEDTRLRGEINAGLTYGGCAKKLHNDLDPDVKMIFMLRNPVDRSFSAYKYFLARGFLPLWVVRMDEQYGHAEAFDRYVHRILESRWHSRRMMKHRLKYLVLSQSRFGFCIDEYLRYFPGENMQFVFFEDFVADQHKSCQEIYDFLGIEDAPGIRYNLKTNEGKEKPKNPIRSKMHLASKIVYYIVYEFCCMPHWAPKFYRHFHRLFRKAHVRCLRPDRDSSRVQAETRQYLAGYFAEDIERVEEITGRDLSAWKQAAAKGNEIC